MSEQCAELDPHPDVECDRIELCDHPASDQTSQGLSQLDHDVDNDLQDGRCAEDSWRKLRGFRHLAKVIEGVKFKDGIEVT